MCKDHQEGFEKEYIFHETLYLARKENPIIMARTIRNIIHQVAPDFLDGLFEARPCVRKLKYIGCGCPEVDCSDGPDFFKIGEIYESIDFTGATYTIKGYDNGKSRIGFEYFEWVEFNVFTG